MIASILGAMYSGNVCAVSVGAGVASDEVVEEPVVVVEETAVDSLLVTEGVPVFSDILNVLESHEYVR